MEYRKWPEGLRERLGDRGVAALAEVLDTRDQDVLSIATDRFERRLTAECGMLRAEMRELRGELRAEMQQLGASLRTDLKIEIANTRADLLKWSFLFWVGQVAAVTGLVTLLR